MTEALLAGADREARQQRIPAVRQRALAKPAQLFADGDLEDAEISRLGETDPTVSELKAQGELCPARVGAIREAT